MNLSQDLQLYFPNEEQSQQFHDFFDIKEKPSKIETQFYKKTEKYLKYISWLPGLRMVWVGNTIAMNCSKKSSDIDLYIVTSPKRMWIIRICVTFIFQILWVRKTVHRHAGRFCLSFFSTTEALNFWEFKIDNDIYLYFWIVYFKPILNKNNTYEKFIDQNTSWADLSIYDNIIQENKKYILYNQQGAERNIFSKIWNICESCIKYLFLPKTLKHYEKIWKPYWVIINNNMLKFHNWDIRKEISQKFHKKNPAT